MMYLLQAHAIGFNLEGSRTSFLDPIGYDFFHSLFQRCMEDNSELARQYMAAVRMHPLQEVKETDTLQIMKIATFINEDSLLQEFDRQLDVYKRQRISCVIITVETGTGTCPT